MPKPHRNLSNQHVDLTLKVRTANSRQVGGTHYRSTMQHWDFVISNDMPYMEAMIFKYVLRWRAKGGLQDLEKAQHFLEKLLEVNKNWPLK